MARAREARLAWDTPVGRGFALAAVATAATGFAMAAQQNIVSNYFEHELGSSKEITPEMHERARWLQRLRWRIGWFLVTSIDYTVTRRLALRVP